MKSSSLNELYSRNPKTVTYVLSQSRLWHLKLIVPRETKNCQSLYSSKKMLVNGNQNVHVGYSKPQCSMLDFYKSCVSHWNKRLFFS